MQSQCTLPITNVQVLLISKISPLLAPMRQTFDPRIHAEGNVKARARVQVKLATCAYQTTSLDCHQSPFMSSTIKCLGSLEYVLYCFCCHTSTKLCTPLFQAEHLHAGVWIAPWGIALGHKASIEKPGRRKSKNHDIKDLVKKLPSGIAI